MGMCSHVQISVKCVYTLRIHMYVYTYTCTYKGIYFGLPNGTRRPNVRPETLSPELSTTCKVKGPKVGIICRYALNPKTLGPGVSSLRDSRPECAPKTRTS